ncbi:MBOAT family protein [bacterium]|nr:MBOAT family protein [bacterium]
MDFTSYAYLYLLAITCLAYWLIRRRTAQNALLLVVSYAFLGWIHPWFAILLAGSTLANYAFGLAIGRSSLHRKLFLTLSLATNLALLGFFKYFNFFAANAQAVLGAVGLQFSPSVLGIALPLGISFYTFQAMAYVIDVYRGDLEPRRNLLDFALFLAAFPQLTMGPIERGRQLLPQLERPRRWSAELFYAAWPLLVRGYLKKLVIANNLARLVDPIFRLDQPSAWLLAAAGVAYTVQIFADFSGYTDIARGSAKLFGLDLTENFRAPYLAVSPSDFWRRWHITFSTWIRDYLYIPLGGSRVGPARLAFVLLVTMGLAGLWHGAAWNFVAWGVLHAILLYAYHRLGMGGRWRPTGWWRTALAWAAMFAFTVCAWTLFRTPSLGWLAHVASGLGRDLCMDSLLVAATKLAFVAAYSLPLLILHFAHRFHRTAPPLHGLLHGLAIACIVLLAPGESQEFVYAQF